MRSGAEPEKYTVATHESTSAFVSEHTNVIRQQFPLGNSLAVLCSEVRGQGQHHLGEGRSLYSLCHSAVPSRKIKS